MDKVLRAHLQTLTERRDRLTQEGMERYQQNGNVEDSRCRDIHLHCTRLNEQIKLIEQELNIKNIKAGIL